MIHPKRVGAMIYLVFVICFLMACGKMSCVAWEWIGLPCIFCSEFIDSFKEEE